VAEEKRCYDEAAGDYCQSLTFRDAHGVSSMSNPLHAVYGLGVYKVF